ncbi:MAG: HRDC domain-containing protein, partial [Gammaproteobacteria bacterium]|nr:HRDC domain-containing protein [Gammaproteobacteria bacterium]
WKSIYRQLVAMAYINIDVDKFGALVLTEKARPLLRGEVTLTLRKLKKSSGKKSTSSKKTELRDIDQDLFEELRQCRYNLSQKEGVPPYVIFHDKTLIEMARIRPESLKDMTLIAGIGEKKLEKFGSQFLDILQQHQIHPWLKNNLSDTINETLNLFINDQDIPDIASSRELTISTVYSHLSKAIESNVITINDISNIEENDIDLVKYAINMCESEGQDGNKAIFDSLNGEIDYGIISCVRASLQSIV